MLLRNKKDDGIKEAVLELYKLNANFKDFEKRYKSRKSEYESVIKKFMSAKNDSQINFDNVDVKLIKQKKVIFDAEKLEQVINDKELLNEIIIKEYTITDMVGLSRYLKSCGVNPKIFKTFLHVEKSVDMPTIDRMFDVGDLKLEDLNDAYTVSENEGYIKINIKKE